MKEMIPSMLQVCIMARVVFVGSGPGVFKHGSQAKTYLES